MTKNQPTNTAIAAMKGNSKRRVVVHRCGERRAARAGAAQKQNELNDESSQPNHMNSAAMNAPHAITDANAKMPPASQRSIRRNASAFAASSTKISSAHAEYAAAPNCPDR